MALAAALEQARRERQDSLVPRAVAVVAMEAAAAAVRQTQMRAVVEVVVPVLQGLRSPLQRTEAP